MIAGPGYDGEVHPRPADGTVQPASQFWSAGLQEAHHIHMEELMLLIKSIYAFHISMSNHRAQSQLHHHSCNLSLLA